MIQYLALSATFVKDSFSMGWKNILPHWSMLGVGLCLFVSTFGVFLGFPFKLIDAMFRLMFICALMPLWVILWVLPATRDYSKKAFDMFLHVLITFICLSVILLMVLTILSVAIDQVANNQDFWNKMMSGKTKEALSYVNWDKGTFFTMLAMSFLALSLVGKTESFVDQFAGGSAGSGVGEALQGRALAGAGLVGSKFLKPALQKGGKVIKTGIKKSPYAVGFVTGRIKSGKPLRWSDLPGSGLVQRTAQSYREGVEEGFGKPLPASNNGAGNGSGGTGLPPGGGSTPPPGGGGGGNSSRNGGSSSNDAARKAADEAKKAADTSKKESGAAKRSSEEAKKAFDEAKNALNALGTGNAKSLDDLLKNPANLASIVSAVSGGSIPIPAASAGLKVASTVVNETLSNGTMKETRTSIFKNEDGQMVQQNVESTIRDRANNVLSQITRHELTNPETKAVAAIEIERDLSGKIVNVVREVKENGLLVQQLKTDVQTGKTTDLLKRP